MRVKITLACTETGDRNYTTKNKRNNPDRIELMKYSPKLKKTHPAQGNKITLSFPLLFG